MSAIVCGGMAQELKPIQLNAPDKSTGLTIMKSLDNRASVREFADSKLTIQELSDLLWAANGINRPDKTGRTAPSSMNAQDIDVYAVMDDGAYWYDFTNNQLKPIAKGDYRKWVADAQADMAKAPVFLVLVSDLSRLRGTDENLKMRTACIDAGTVCQNISLFCSGTGLVTVPRASMNQSELKKILQLKDSQRLIMNHPVGHKK